MKHFLTVALLAMSSTALAESYLCHAEEGFHYEVGDSNQSKRLYKMEGSFFLDSSESGSIFYYHNEDGSYAGRMCNAYIGAFSKNILICSNNYGELRLDKVSKKYISTDIIQPPETLDGTSVHIEYGKCAIFNGQLE